MKSSKGGLQFGCGDLIWLPLSVHVCLCLVVEYWIFVGACTHHSYSKLYCLCHLASFFKCLPPPTPHRHPSCPLLYIRWLNLHERNYQKLSKISHYLLTCQDSCTKANRLLSMLSKWVQFQGKTAYSKLNF